MVSKKQDRIEDYSNFGAERSYSFCEAVSASRPGLSSGFKVSGSASLISSPPNRPSSPPDPVEEFKFDFESSFLKTRLKKSIVKLERL